MKKYDVLSPDGFAIRWNGGYKTKKEAIADLMEWIKIYIHQGYYSSVNYGRIPIEEIPEYCQLIKIK